MTDRSWPDADRTGREGRRWGMVVDLRRCVGCQTCTIACKQEHALPAGYVWRFVADCEVGEYPDVRRVFLPMQCMHCGVPPCVPVCPTGASRQREDGIVWIDYQACVGCGYCAMACPYHARHLVHAATGYFDRLTPPEVHTGVPGRHGVMTKCTFCRERVDDGMRRGLTPGTDMEATPMCAAACIAGAIVFGDLDDPASRVARLISEAGAVPLTPECGTDPRVYYITGAPATGTGVPVAASEDAVATPPPSRTPGLGLAAGERARGVEPPALIPAVRQTLWRTPAVLNFTLGGLGAGLYATAAVASGFADSTALRIAAWLGPALVLAGFAAVAAEAGRPLRGARVLTQVRTSWMSRELWIGGLFVAVALLEHLTPAAPLRALATAAAVALVVAQGAILRAARGVTAWDVPVMPAVFLMSAWVSGTGGFLLLRAADGAPAGPPLLALTAVLLVFAAIVWLVYLTWSTERSFQDATAPLRDGRLAVELAGIGYVIPFMLATLGLAIPEWREGVAPLAGLAMIAGQARAKHALLRQAGLLRPIEVRLSPTRAARARAVHQRHPTPGGGA